MSEHRQAASRSVDLALVALKRGDLADAADMLTAALKADPLNPDAYYHLARVYGLAGRDEAAVQVFRIAIGVLPDDFLSARTFVHYQGRVFDASTTRNFFAALADTTPVLRGYLAPSPWLGCHSNEQTTEQDAAIAEWLDTCRTNWQAGQTAKPSLASAFLDRQYPKDVGWPRTLVFMPQHISGNPDFVTSTYASHTYASLQELGVPTAFHDAGHLCFDATNPDSIWDGRKSKTAALAEFDACLANMRPDVVIMDGMFAESNATIGRDDLLRLKARYGFKLVDLVADSYPPLTNYAAYWAPVSDLTVTLSGGDYLAEIATGKTFLAPCQALASSLIHPCADAQKTIDLLYAGARTRNRDFWCAHAVTAGIDTTVAIGDRRSGLAQSERDFYETLGRAKLALSNGFVSDNLDIVVFRPFEAAASGTVTLHNGKALERCFVPYVHYLPFDNVDELICLSRFLLSHETYRVRMRDDAKQFWHDHYRGELFWRAIFARMDA